MKQMLCRDNQIFKRGIISALALTLVFALICAAVGIASYRDASSGAEAVKVALVDEEDSILSRLAIALVEGQSYMQRLMSVSSADAEEEALAMLADGECAAVIILPEGYLDDLMTGEACQGRIILSEAAASSAELVRELAECGQLLIAAGQEGVFSGERYIIDRELGWDIHSEYLDSVNTELISFATDVYDIGFAEDTVPYAGTGIPTEAHFAASWLALLLFVSGLFFADLYTEDVRRPLLQRLIAAGVTPWRFISGKLLFPGAFRLVLFGVLLVLLGQFVPVTVSAYALLCLLAAIATATVTVSCTAVLLAGRGNWQGLILIVSAAGLFLVGGIVPRGMLSEVLVTVGDYTPLGAVRTLLLPLMGGKAELSALAAPVYAGAALLLSIRRLRCVPEKGGAL